MGYRSQVIIAVDKAIYDVHAQNKTVPEALYTEDYELVERVTDNERDAVYWHLDGWKWYDSYKDVQLILEWLELLDKEESLAQLIRPKVAGKHGFNMHQMFTDEQPPYGFLRTGEDKEDIEERGDPSHFDMSVEVSIMCPLDYI